MKNEIEKGKNNNMLSSVKNGPLNFPENNMNSIVELRMNALRLELRLGSP